MLTEDSLEKAIKAIQEFRNCCQKSRLRATHMLISESVEIWVKGYCKENNMTPKQFWRLVLKIADSDECIID